MKKYILPLFVSFFLLFSCTDMDLAPLSEGSSESWYSNETEINMSINYLYFWRFWDIDPDPANYGNMGWRDSWSDNWTNRNIVSPFAAGTVTAQTAEVTNLWTVYYTCIAACNNLIERLIAPIDGLDDTKRERYLAEALFTRAAQYSKLIFRWGDVPYLDKTVTIDEAFAMGRTDKMEILNHIYEDFDYAAAHLPISYAASVDKKATKGAALALKARIALYFHDYQTAKKAAKDCMDLGVYELFPDFSSMYSVLNKNMIESVMAIPRSIELKVNPAANVTQQPLPRTAAGNSYFWPSWELFYSFLCTDGLPVDESPLFDPQKPFENRDPRCAASIVEFNTPWGGYIYQPHPDSLTTLNLGTGLKVQNNDTRGVVQWASWNGLIWKKRIDDSWFGDFLTDPDHIVIRYADVLLIYAEAKIELDELDETVLSAMNQVRARAYGVTEGETTQYPVIGMASQTELRKTLRIERRMEFAFEGTRYDDLIRWRLAEKVLNKPIYGMLDLADIREKIVKPKLWFLPETAPVDEDGISDFQPLLDKGYVRVLALRSFDKDKHYLWPIPSSEIIINENMTQNPNY